MTFQRSIEKQVITIIIRSLTNIYNRRLYWHFIIDDNIHVDAHYMYIKNECIKTLSQQVVPLELNRRGNERREEKKRNTVDNDIRQKQLHLFASTILFIEKRTIYDGYS